MTKPIKRKYPIGMESLEDERDYYLNKTDLMKDARFYDRQGFAPDDYRADNFSNNPEALQQLEANRNAIAQAQGFDRNATPYFAPDDYPSRQEQFMLNERANTADPNYIERSATPSTQGSWVSQPTEGTIPTGQGTVYEGGAADTAMKGGVPESGGGVSPLALMMVANMVGKIGQGNQNQMDSMPAPSAPVAGGRVFTPPSVQPSSLLADLNRRKRRSF